jgi:hypothetical protein
LLGDIGVVSKKHYHKFLDDVSVHFERVFVMLVWLALVANASSISFLYFGMRGVAYIAAAGQS